MTGPRTRVEGLDLLRGLAVGLVVLRHAVPHVFPGAGVVGVVMFFALSGYLITGVLLDAEGRGRADLRAFYLRRAHRLVPALLVLVAAVAAVTLVADPLGDAGELGRTVVVALTWTANLPFDHGSDATFHLWTLATEEQFYLLWPAVLLLAVRRGRVGAALVATGLACLLACTATVLWLREAPDLAYALPTSWAGCFVVGAAARLRGGAVAAAVRARPAVLPVALAVLLVLGVVPLRGSASTYLLGGPVIAALTAVLVLGWRARVRVEQPWLRPLVALGTVSYGAYLWSYPLTLWCRAWLGGTDPGGQQAVAGLVAAVLTVAAAALSWRYVERPWLARAARRAAPVPLGAAR